MGWPELRLQLALWLHQSWPFRLVAWLRLRRVPKERGFGQFRAHAPGQDSLQDVVNRLLAEITRLTAEEVAINIGAQMTISKIDQARACLADAKRPENSPLTCIDAAISAIALVAPEKLEDKYFTRYQQLKYTRPLTDQELTFYYATIVGIADTLLSKREDEPQSNPVTLAAIEAAKSGEVTDVSPDDL